VLYWVRSHQPVVPLQPSNAAEIAFLALASLYSFAIVAKGQIDLIDTIVLAAFFGGYIWRLSQLANEPDEGDEEVGPAAALRRLPNRRQYAVIAILAISDQPFWSHVTARRGPVSRVGRARANADLGR
jgi:cation:H+ antiporter